MATQTLPATMRALILNAPLKTATVNPSTPLPTLQAPNQLLIRVEAIALNPVDALYTTHPLGASGRVVGSDFSGVVVQATTTTTTAASVVIGVGDRVAGFLQGACSANPRPGAFAEYVVCDADLVWKIPAGMGYEEAAGVSLCALTAAQGVFYRLGVGAPFVFEGAGAATTPAGNSGEEGGVVRFFVYGASTSVGMYAAQLVRLGCEASGRRLVLIGAASRARWGMLKGGVYGYDVLVDYRDADWAEQVRAATGGEGVDFACDCISEGETVARVASTLKRGGRMAIVRSREGGAWAAADGELPTEPIYGAVWEGLGEEIQYQGFVVPASERARKFAASFYAWLSKGGKLEPNPVRLMPGGLGRVVPDGFVLLGTGTMDARQQDRPEEWMRPISAEKLVYRIRD